MAIKGFFFDLDGTLVDTHRANYLAYKHAIENVTMRTLDQELEVMIRLGESSDVFLVKLLPGISNDDVLSINKLKKEVYPSYLGESRLNEYLANFLGQMSEHYVTALVTTAKKTNAMSVMKAHNLEKYFNFMIFGDDVVSMKPRPDAYLLALKKSNLEAGDVIAFEDSEKGIIAAEAAGIKTIHIRNFL
jgi:beta-phosphoglucomutase